MTTDYDLSYELDDHRVDEIDIEYAWAFAVFAVAVLVAMGLATLIG